MERKIGESFKENELITLKVIESFSCENCYYLIDNPIKICILKGDLMNGHCSHKLRSDKKSVIFKRIT